MVEQVAITDARDDLAEVVNRVTYRGERVVLTRRGKRVVAVVPIADLELLERLEDAARRELREETGLPVGLAGVVWLQDLVERRELVVVFAGWLAAGHDGVLSLEPDYAGHDRHLVEVAWRDPHELLAGDFRPAALLKLLDFGNLPELARPES